MREIQVALTTEQIEQRIEQYRAEGFQQRAMPHILYRSPFIVCPCDGCDREIAGIDFQLELLGDEELHTRLMKAWWKRSGLIGRCPGCSNHVLFTMQDKQIVEVTDIDTSALLPDNWYEVAYILG